jgi:hypothetical protein
MRIKTSAKKPPKANVQLPEPKQEKKPEKPKRTCAADGCTETIPDYVVFCQPHTGMLPGRLRLAVWQNCKPGQEKTEAYASTWEEARDAIAKREGK